MFIACLMLLVVEDSHDWLMELMSCFLAAYINNNTDTGFKYIWWFIIIKFIVFTIYSKQLKCSSYTFLILATDLKYDNT